MVSIEPSHFLYQAYFLALAIDITFEYFISISTFRGDQFHLMLRNANLHSLNNIGAYVRLLGRGYTSIE